MNEKPQRRYWQLHLSTLILLVLIGAVMIGFNLKPFHCSLEYNEHSRDFVDFYGWPKIAVSVTSLEHKTFSILWRWTGVMANIACFALVLACSYVTLEFFARD